MPLSTETAALVDQVAGLVKPLHVLLGDRAFDDLALTKTVALRRKLDAAQTPRRATQVCLAHNLRHAVPVNPGREYLRLDADFLDGELDRLPERAVYLLLNNDIGKRLPRYLELVQRRPHSLFVIWDWDSQHWLQMGCTLAAASDFYVPAASENLYTLSHFNPHLLGPAFAAVNQWSRAFVVEHMDVLLRARSDQPFGPHVPYDGFARRNRAVNTLHRSFPAIGFTNHGYQGKSELDNLVEWAGHKAHWIVPVLGGVPIRVYNCLLTGGIAVMPAHYRALPEAVLFDGDAVYYDVIDLIDPQAAQREAIERFDAVGGAGVVERVGRALARHHIDARVEQVLTAVDEALARLQAGRRSGPEQPYLMAR
jgi:hypothetical protein